MATSQVTYTLSTKLNSIKLDFVNMRLIVVTDILNDTTGSAVSAVSDDVTSLLTPEQIAAALLLINAAKAYAEAKVP